MNQFLSFDKDRVQEITLEQLKKTHKENSIDGKPLKGIYHFDLIDRIEDLISQFGLKPEIYDLFACNNKERMNPGVVILPQVEEIYGERAVEAHVLRRVFCNMRLTNYDNDEFTTNLSIAFHQKGIQIGFGQNVKICHNQCMLNAEDYVSTYGNGRGTNRSIEDCLEVVKGWLVDSRNKVEADRETIRRMMNINVSAQELFTLIGMLTATRVKCDSSNDLIHVNDVYPLNNAQINDFTERMLIKYETDHAVSLFDVYNAATEQYKATAMDITKIIPQNLSMTSFLNDMYHFM